MKLHIKKLTFSVLVCLCTVVGSLGCSGSSSLDPTAVGQSPVDPTDTGKPQNDLPEEDQVGSAGSTNVVPFVALKPSAYVTKVKTLLTGLPANTEEIISGSSDEGLAKLVDAWMETPQYQEVLFTFFRLAFQTSSFDRLNLYFMFGDGDLPGNVERQFREMFPRTASYFVKNNLPFNELMTTRKFMVTPRMLRKYAVMDASNKPDNNGGFRQDVLAPSGKLSITLDPTAERSQLTTLKNAQEANYLRFSWPKIAMNTSQPSYCGFGSTQPKELRAPPTIFNFASGNVAALLRGDGFVYFIEGKPGPCYVPGDPSRSLIPPGDDTWRLVQFQTPTPQNAANSVLDLDVFASADQVTFRIPRVGFFTTPGFLAQWPTNINNQFRTTINQTLLVGLHKYFNGGDQTTPKNLGAIPLQHASPSSGCYSCHLTMDPMRQYFRNELTTSYTPQYDSNQLMMAGSWGQDGIQFDGGGLVQLGKLIAESPVFSMGWTLKLCGWLNSAPCSASDPEVKRIAKEFTASNFNFNHLMKQLAVSDLTTYRRETKTAQQRGVVITMARSSQMCQVLGARLNWFDMCRHFSTTPGQAWVDVASDLLGVLPSDSFTRGAPNFNQPALGSMVQRIGVENACSYLSFAMVENGAVPSPFFAGDKQAVQKIGTQLMGLAPGVDDEVLAILQRHYTDALSLTKDKTAALRSTFVLACTSPQVSTIGGVQ